MQNPTMGAWGPAIFSDDTACDIRGDYRELIEDGVDDREATQRVIDAYQHLGDDESHVLWLALAAAQSALGRLDEDVKARALAVIDGDVGLELWAEAGTKELAKRKSALAKLRVTLIGPQPAPKRVRRPSFHVTDLAPGDVLAYELPDSHYALFRVARVDEHRVGVAPILRRLDWNKSALPSDRKLRRLRPMPEPRPNDPGPSVSFRVAKHRKKDEDWRDVGFVIVGRANTDTADAAYQPRIYTAWRALRTALDNGWQA